MRRESVGLLQVRNHLINAKATTTSAAAVSAARSPSIATDLMRQCLIMNNEANTSNTIASN